MKHSLLSFQKRLESLGFRLVIRRCADSTQALQELVQETGAQAVLFNNLYDPISLVRDHEVKQMLGRCVWGGGAGSEGSMANPPKHCQRQKGF